MNVTQGGPGAVDRWRAMNLKDYIEQPDIRALLDDEPVGRDGFGAPLYAHRLPAEGVE